MEVMVESLDPYSLKDPSELLTFVILQGDRCYFVDLLKDLQFLEPNLVHQNQEGLSLQLEVLLASCFFHHLNHCLSELMKYLRTRHFSFILSSHLQQV